MAAERVFRPVRTRAFSVALSTIVIGSALIGWFALPAHIRALFTAFQLVTLVIILAFMVTAMLLVGFSAVRSHSGGLTVRNGPFVKTIPWENILGFRFRHGDPWAYVLHGAVDDVSRHAMLGVQATDGARATESVEWLRAQLASR